MPPFSPPYVLGKCFLCAPGRYNEMAGLAGATKEVEGSEGAALDPSSSCKVCPGGWFLEELPDPFAGDMHGVEHDSGRTACTACPAGFTTRGEPAAGAARCARCLTGKYLAAAASAAACVDCPEGKANGNFGSGKASDCRDCKRNQWCPAGSDCPAGQYYDGANCDRTCATAAEAAAARDETLGCPAGSYCRRLADGSVERRPCPAGCFCVAHSRVPERCSDGTENQLVQSVSVAACQGCIVASHCAYGTCAIGYMEAGCSKCWTREAFSQPYYKDSGGDCVECPKIPVRPIVMGCVAVVAALMFARAELRSWEQLAALQQVANFVQVLKVTAYGTYTLLMPAGQVRRRK